MKHECGIRPCGMHIVVCPDVRPAKPEDDQCDSAARASIEIPCPCPAKMHTVLLCAEHYDWWMGIQKLAENLRNGD